MVLTEYGALMVRRLIFWNYMHVVNVHYFTVRVISLKSQWNYMICRHSVARSVVVWKSQHTKVYWVTDNYNQEQQATEASK